MSALYLIRILTDWPTSQTDNTKIFCLSPVIFFVRFFFKFCGELVFQEVCPISYDNFNLYSPRHCIIIGFEILVN